MADRYYSNTDMAQRFQPGTTVESGHVDQKFDEVTSGFEMVERDIDRSIKLPDEGADQLLNNTAAERRNKVVGFDSEGRLALLATKFNWREDWQPDEPYAVNDMVRDPGTKNIYIAPTMIEGSATFIPGQWSLAINVEDVESAKADAVAAKQLAVQAATTSTQNATTTAEDRQVITTKAEEVESNRERAETARQEAEALYGDLSAVEQARIDAEESSQAAVNSAQASLFQADRSSNEADRSEAARDAAFINASVYADVAAGLAATTTDDQFQVVVGDEIVRYRNDSGAAVEVARYPSATLQDIVKHGGIKPFFVFNAQSSQLYKSAGYDKTVIDGVIRFAPNEPTVSTVGYAANSAIGASREFSPKQQSRVGYRMRHFSGSVGPRLYSVQLTDTAGNVYAYQRFQENEYSTGRVGGWATHIVDISKKPDGTDWGGEIINGIYIALYATSANDAIIDIEWVAVGNAVADFATNADLSREFETIRNTDIPGAVNPVADAAAAAGKYGMSSVSVEFSATLSPGFLYPSGFTQSVANDAVRYDPSGIGSGGGWAARTLSSPLDPKDASRVRYKIRAVGGSDERYYLVYFRDTDGVGHYYHEDSAGVGLRDSQGYVVYDIDTSKRADGTAWPDGVKIEQIWLSLSDRAGDTSWELKWFVVGAADSLYTPMSVPEHLNGRIDAIERRLPSAGAIRGLLSALTNPLHSVEIQLIGDSITWGVGSSGATDDGSGHNVMTNNSWANLFHKWLGESYVDGSLSASLGEALYTERSRTALSNSVHQSGGSLGFYLTSNGSAPESSYNASSITYGRVWEFSSPAGSAKNNSSLAFSLTGDNLTFVYSPTDAADLENSIVELWGNGSKLGEFSYYGAEAWQTEQEIAFPFGHYEMEMVVRSATNTFLLEGFKCDRYIKVVNDAISGTSTGSWLPGSANLDAALAKRAEFVLMQLGTNDRGNESGSFATYIFSTRIAEALINAGRKVVVMSSNAVSDATDYGSGKVYSQRRVTDALRNMASDLRLDFIDNYQATVPAKILGEEWTADGLHPNDYGHKIIFENVRRRIIEQV